MNNSLGFVLSFLHGNDGITDLVQSIENVFFMFDGAIGDERRDNFVEILSMFRFKAPLNESIDGK